MSNPTHRLAGILRYFRLPHTASQADLRQAYLHEVKRLHPDITKSKPPHDEFADLQVRFEDGMALFEQIAILKKQQVVNTTRLARGYSTTSAEPKPPPVAAVGMPALPVYAAFGGFSLAGALWWSGVFDKKPAPAKQEYHDVEGETTKQATLARYKQAVPLTKSRDAILKQVDPQVHNGVELGTAHVAAEDGSVWWLEKCWASGTCRKSLFAGDKNLDTPLHHAARSGRRVACQTLLRYGAKADSANRWKILPEELAAMEGYNEIEEMIRSFRFEQDQNASESDPSKITTTVSDKIKRHPDGLGILRDPPHDLPYGVPHPSNSLRYAVNLASGFTVLRHQKLDKANVEEHCPDPVPGVSQEVRTALEHVRTALKGTGFDLENLPIDAQLVSSPDGDGWRDQPASSRSSKYTMYDQHLQTDEVCGLIGLEPAGHVTKDSPDNWFAVRVSRPPIRKPAAHEGGVGVVVNLSGRDRQSIFRHDPVRGPYELTEEELAELASQYKLWRVIRRERLRALKFDGLPSSGACSH